jgi:hypothetical protein
MPPSNQDTTVADAGDDILDVVRKAVRQIGKEAATHRFTLDEKNSLAEIEYTYRRQGIRTSENEITRIAINRRAPRRKPPISSKIIANTAIPASSQKLKRLNS